MMLACRIDKKCCRIDNMFGRLDNRHDMVSNLQHFLSIRLVSTKTIFHETKLSNGQEMLSN